ncbi:hypothetical protein ACN6MT_03220 [Neobacillus niacini]|uniref:hypothetical protein n=1 Tax=Neobacillus niacini TaxID=86668 RepID=UPI003B0125B6
MNRNQVKDVLRLIKNNYHQFEVTTDKIDDWTRMLSDQNPAVVMRNVEKHILECRFPPVISDLIERKHESFESNILQQLREWEKNAARK